MTMNHVTSFILYVMLFRICTIGAGVICIVLGYKLFIYGVIQGGSDAEAKMGDFKLTLKNAAPGTCFALFGALIIAFNFWQGGPEVTIKSFEQATTAMSKSDAKPKIGEEIIFKGESEQSIKMFTERGIDYEKQQKPEKAKQEYMKALKFVGEPMNNLASLFLSEGAARKALVLADFAAKTNPEKASFLHTYSTALDETGKKQDAIRFMRKAAELNPKYENDLKRLTGK